MNIREGREGMEAQDALLGFESERGNVFLLCFYLYLNYIWMQSD